MTDGTACKLLGVKWLKLLAETVQICLSGIIKVDFGHYGWGERA
ncbi:hypothetical protein MGWOODY_Clf950 [hydrothermal vent metagenome]|uniref:Uncharacterized protein n=1 Tax=hydrothermal vent metagenome TaxID=652676 RepID=A0A160VA48_9ZZZZ